MQLDHQRSGVDDDLLSVMPLCPIPGRDRHTGLGDNSRLFSVSSLTDGIHGAETPFGSIPRYAVNI
jgi:hypothetical protein